MLMKNKNSVTWKSAPATLICDIFLSPIASRVEYCPTGELTADYFTKPLQGALFKTFRNRIMTADPSTDSLQDCSSVLRNPDEAKIRFT